MPDIPDEFELEWSGEEGTAKIEDHEIRCGSFIIYASFEINEIAEYDPGDHLTEPSFSSLGRDHYNFEIDLHSHDMYVYELTPFQHESIANAIINKLKKSNQS